MDIVSAFFGALYFLASARNVKKVPICVLILIMNFHNWIINSCLSKESNSDMAIFSFDVEYGCLGFLNLANNNLLVLSV